MEDKEQDLVVSSNEEMLVMAGPGSGKTRVITRKCQRLFDAGEDFVCFTFTRSAAEEIRSRIPGISATTIHSFCREEVGWKDTRGYNGLLVDFLVLKRKPKFNWVLLDEAQDVNPMEFQVVKSVVAPEGKLFAVGDPYQSIYGFQGALGPILVTHFNKIVPLHNNYRSCPEVIDKLNKVYSRGLVSRGVKETGLTFILCRTNNETFYVSKELENRGIPHKLRIREDYKDGEEETTKEYIIIGPSDLKVSTVHTSKGTECDRSLLFGWRPVSQGEEKRIYYVAMSRASQEFKEINSIGLLLRSLENLERCSNGR